jgi:hypothetical protein
MPVNDGRTADPLPPPEIEVRLRIIGASLIIAALIIALIALGAVLKTLAAEQALQDLVNQKYDPTTRELVQAHLQNTATAASGMFGALTTFLGTALGAYFGIAAAGSSTKAANAAIMEHAQLSHRLAAQAQSDNAELRNHLVDIAARSGGSAGNVASSSTAQPADMAEAADGADFGPVLDPVDEGGHGHASGATAAPAYAGLAPDVLPAGSAS